VCVKGVAVESLSNFFDRKSISRNPAHSTPEIYRLLLTGEMLKDKSKGRESKQSQEYNEQIKI